MTEPPIAYSLTSACGHHCGVQTSNDVRLEGHCPCTDCHGEPTGPMEVRKIEVLP